jgi:hypothetical protein
MVLWPVVLPCVGGAALILVVAGIVGYSVGGKSYGPVSSTYI